MAKEKLLTLKLTAKEIRLCRDALFHAARTNAGDYKWGETERTAVESIDLKLYEAIPKWQRAYHQTVVGLESGEQNATKSIN